MIKSRLFIVYSCMVGILAIGGSIIPESLSFLNLSSVLLWSGLLGIVAIGQTVVILSGGIDMSVGMIVFLVLILVAGMMRGNNLLALPAILLCLGIGVAVGFVNGIYVAKFKIPSIVVTLCMMMILQGVIYVYTRGIPKGGVAPALVTLGRGTIGKTLPIPTLIWIAIAVAMSIVMHKTKLGREIHATGNNPTAAWLMGINTERITIISFIISGLCSALTGIILVGFLSMATLYFTDIYTFGSMIAVVIGGTSFFQGIGTIEGTIAGTIIIRFLFSLITMMNIPEVLRKVIEGVTLLGVAAAYSRRK